MNRKTALITAALLALLTAVLVVVFVLRLSRSPNARVQLGDSVFEVGQVRRLAPPIARQGPLLFPDLLRRGRTIYVQHLGSDDKTGWLAFEGHAPETHAPETQAPGCQVRWDAGRQVFVDPCDGGTYPPDGTGLVHYPTVVKEKKKAGFTLYVDLRNPSGTTPQPATD
ncbi:MAG TPA: hypothetical protein VFA94_02665 [Acidimicrobiales bacterium]|nr:hypothetical protein [Acidimicrobiales bacterium]